MKKYSDHLLSLLTILALALLGIFFTLVNLGLPIIRNSLLYAKISELIMATGGSVCTEPTMLYGKMCMFSLLSLPGIAIFGSGIGLKITSFFGTLLFVVFSYYFFKIFTKREGLHVRSWLILIISFLNPLFIYQFWSAYSDTLFASLFILSLVAVEKIIVSQKNYIRYFISLLLIMVLGTSIKYFGLIFPFSTLFYYFLFGKTRERSKLIFLCLIQVIYFVFIYFLLVGNGGAESIFNEYFRAIDFVGNIEEIIVMLLISFNVLVLTPWSRVCIKKNSRILFFSLSIFLLIFTYPSSKYNMRYYIVIFPFVGFFISINFYRFFSPLWRKLVFSVFLVTNLFLIVNCNWSNAFSLKSLYRMIPSIFRSASRIRYLDNLRLDAHLFVKSELDFINKTLSTGDTLYFYSDYYGDGTHGVFKDGGLLRNDINVVYVRNRSIDLANEAYLYIYNSHADWAHENPFKGTVLIDHNLWRVSNISGKSY